MTITTDHAPTVSLERHAGVARVILDRPASLNAWNADLGVDLLAALQDVAADPEVRCVCLTGAGRAFSAGADLKAFGDGPRTPEGLPDLQRVLVERYHPIILLVREMPKPVVAAVNGPAVGIGASLALAADLVVARASASFGLAFVSLGLVPDGGSSAFVTARVGPTRATELAMLGERLGARQALEWGLINRVWEDDAFDDELTAFLERLAAGPTRAHAGVKRLVNAWSPRAVADQLELEAALQQEMAGTQDFAEGVTAFVQKRQARFAGH